MSKYVDIEPIIRKIKYSMETGEIRGRIWFEMVLKDLEDQPTVDAVPVKHGHWEKVDTRGYLSPGGTPTVRCSNCNDRRTEHLSGVEYPEWRNFCPVCGALMDEVMRFGM